MSVDDLRMRAGELACVCGAQEGGDDALDAHDLGRLAAGFGLSALAQALVLSTLPEASRVLAPTLDRLGWPYALLLVGAALATFPAAFLIDAFGRRSAFALGASLGVAGGLLTTFAASRGNFSALCLGAFWLGLAQGFALFYRHIAARGSALATRAGLVVLAGGALAAGGAPALIRFGALFGEGVGPLLIIAAALHALALWAATRLPHAIAPIRLEARPAAASSWRFVAATLGGDGNAGVEDQSHDGGFNGSGWLLMTSSRSRPNSSSRVTVEPRSWSILSVSESSRGRTLSPGNSRATTRSPDSMRTSSPLSARAMSPSK